MKKLSLDLTALRVESFTVQQPARNVGTVRGHQIEDTNGGSCFSWLCFPTDLCGSFNCGTRVMSCRAADCTHEN